MENEKHVEVLNFQKDKIHVEVLAQHFGEYQTNCYVCKFPQGEIVIDPGIGATQWVIEHCKQPLAFLNTHGHFDHIWSNSSLKTYFPNTPLLTPELDHFMLKKDCFNTGVPPSKADILTKCQENKQAYEFNGIKVVFFHFPGHTPGCSIIEIEGCLFTGDFIFYRSIGRSDFPYSNTADMIKSLKRFQSFPNTPNKPIYPGHGQSTSLKDEQHNIALWIRHLEITMAG